MKYKTDKFHTNKYKNYSKYLLFKIIYIFWLYFESSSLETFFEFFVNSFIISIVNHFFVIVVKVVLSDTNNFIIDFSLQIIPAIIKKSKDYYNLWIFIFAQIINVISFKTWFLVCIPQIIFASK